VAPDFLPRFLPAPSCWRVGDRGHRLGSSPVSGKSLALSDPSDVLGPLAHFAGGTVTCDGYHPMRGGGTDESPATCAGFDGERSTRGANVARPTTRPSVRVFLDSRTWCCRALQSIRAHPLDESLLAIVISALASSRKVVGLPAFTSLIRDDPTVLRLVLCARWCYARAAKSLFKLPCCSHSCAALAS
jgi:hypothetical protein